MEKKEIKQKQIVIFSPWAFSTSYYTAQFCNALASGRNRIFLIAPRNFMAHLLSEKIERVSWPFTAPIRTNTASLLNTPIQLFQLLKIIHTIRPHFIHLLWKHHLPLLIKPFFNKAKVGFTVHDPILHSGENGFFRSWVQKQLIDMADALFVHGTSNRNDLLRHYRVNPEKIYTIPHGNMVFRNQVPEIGQENTILFFGRFKKYKGLELLLKSFHMASPRLPGYRLVIRGHGDPKDIPPIIYSMPNVDFENRFVPHEEVSKLFARARFVVLPYLDGTQSGVVSMAFAFGRTCIASAVGSIPEVIKDNENGVLVQPGNERALANKMIELAENSALRERLETNALKTFEKMYLEYRNDIHKIVTNAYNRD